LLPLHDARVFHAAVVAVATRRRCRRHVLCHAITRSLCERARVQRDAIRHYYVIDKIFSAAAIIAPAADCRQLISCRHFPPDYAIIVFAFSMLSFAIFASRQAAYAAFALIHDAAAAAFSPLPGAYIAAIAAIAEARLMPFRCCQATPDSFASIFFSHTPPAKR
jgi:hypothetical protein